MKRTKIVVTIDEEYTHIVCPHCEHWENHPVDEQRHHIQTFDLLNWERTEANKNDLSHMKCCVCEEEFMLEWDYENIEK